MLIRFYYISADIVKIQSKEELSVSKLKLNDENTRKLIEAAITIETQEAKEAGVLGYMARSFDFNGGAGAQP